MQAHTLPLKHIQLIEASAGTGKTWTIAALYVRLILGHGTDATGFVKPLRPRDILVVTFTEAATAELRERIRNRLAEAARFFSGGEHPTGDAFLEALRESYSESKEWRGLAHRLSLAADDMDEAAIFTIHGWCSRMLKQHAFDSGAAFAMEIETDASVLLGEAIRDFWRVAFYPLSEPACQVVQQVVKTPDDLEHKIRDLLKTAPDTLVQLTKPASQAEAIQLLQKALDDCLEKEQALHTIETQARDTWVTHQTDIERILNEAKHLNGSTYRNLQTRLQEFSTWAKAGIPRPDLDHIKYFSSGGFKLNKAVKEEPQHEVFMQLANLGTALSEQETQLKHFTVSLYTQATFWVLDAFARAKKRKSRLDYNDLIFQLNAAIKREQAGERLAAIIRQQYPVAMIDEFQDTDAAQYEIFERIYGQQSDSTAWLMIGDPKQAIYSFRGADIHTYLRAKQREGIQHHTLSVNHRSVQALVNIVNHLFTCADAHKGGAFLFKTVNQDQQVNDPIPFQCVEAKGRPEVWVRNKQTAPALTAWYLPSEQENGTVNFTRYRSVMAEQTANEIARLLNESQTGETGFMRDTQITPLQESDIAILVRDCHEAKLIRQALLRRGLRSVYMSDRDSVYATAEASDLQQCLQAFLSPQEGRAIRAALSTTLLSRTYAEIEQLNTDEAVLEGQIRLFSRYHQLWNSQGVLAAVRQFIMDQHLHERLLAQPGGERSLTNMLHLAELLQTEGVHRDGPEGLLRYFQDACQEQEYGNDQNIIRLESDDGLIRVVTLHKSKGLEYPLVFMPFVCGYKELKDDKLSYYSYHDGNGAIKLELKTEKNTTLLETMKRERLQEDLRLLYVGLTRARQACWLGIAPLVSGNSRQNTLHQGAFGYILNGQNKIENEEVKSRLETLLSMKNASLVEISPKADLIQAQTRQSEPKQAKTREFNSAPYTPWWVASYSALKFGQASASLEAADTAQLELGRESTMINPDIPASAPAGQGLHGFPAGTEPGMLLHAVLESIARRGFDNVAQDQKLLEELIRKTIKHKAYIDWHSLLGDWLHRFITNPFPLDGGTLALSSLTNKNCITEMEFWFETTQVGTHTLDELVSGYTLNGSTRPQILKNTLHGMLKGFIDLVFIYQGRYYVLDYKSNRLGSGQSCYSTTQLQSVMASHRYDMQYTLYVLALHRHLKSRLKDCYDYEKHVGGAIYVFLRGLDNPETHGIYHHKPCLNMIQTLDNLFNPQPEELSHVY